MLIEQNNLKSYESGHAWGALCQIHVLPRSAVIVSQCQVSGTDVHLPSPQPVICFVYDQQALVFLELSVRAISHITCSRIVAAFKFDVLLWRRRGAGSRRIYADCNVIFLS